MTDTARNLGTLADDVPGDRVAIVDLVGEEPRILTYDQVRAEIRAVARALAERGIGPGNRVGILALNRADYLTVAFGAVLTGAISIPLNVKMPAETIRAILQKADIDLVFAEDAFRHVLPDGIATISFEQDFGGFLDFGAFDAAPVNSSTVSMQPYTSGSTGLPKGVLLSHSGQVWAAETLARYRRMRPDHRAIIAAPLYHKNAIVAAKTAFASGSSVVMMSRFDVSAYAGAIERWGVNMLTGVPTMLRMLLDHPSLPEPDVRARVRVISMGSSPASDRLLADLSAAFPNADIALNYGVTEGGPVMFGWHHPDGLRRPRHSVGYPLPGCEWKLVGEKPDEGELFVRNPGVARGYHKRPEATVERFVDGWYRTGDILRHDEHGWFYFVARIDDMMVSGGENVFPQEVEAVLEQHPAVRQAAVIGVAHEIKGQVPVAFVVLENGHSASEAALKEFSLAHAPAYAHPRRVFFMPELPLSGTNKIDKPALKSWIEAADASPANTSSSEGRTNHG